MRTFSAAGFRIDQLEEMDVDVMQARTGAELVQWCRCFGMQRLLDPLPADIQTAWEDALVGHCQSFCRPDGLMRLGGVTRIVVAR